MKFVIKGEPVGKARPRFNRQTGAYTPQKTKDYEELVAMCYKTQCGKKLDGAVKIYICANFKIPQNTNKQNALQMKLGNIRPTKKPDADNIIKIILDGLNGVAYDDDKQVVYVACSKYYSDKPSVIVEIKEE